MSNPFHNFPPFFVSFQSSLVWYFSAINVIYSFCLPQWALKERKKEKKKKKKKKPDIRIELFQGVGYFIPPTSADPANYVNCDTLFQTSPKS